MLSKLLAFSLLFFCLGLQQAALANNQCDLVFLKNRFIDKVSDPFSIEHSLKGEQKNASAIETIKDLEKIHNTFESMEPNSNVQIEALNKWVRSEVHALYLYVELHKFGLEKYKKTFSWLLKNNDFFMDALTIRATSNTLVTYGFEKEGLKKDVAMFYRDPRISEDDWFSLSDGERMARLSKLIDTKKKFHSANIIQSTELKPEYLDGYSEEFVDGRRKGFMWELRHKLFEFSLPRLMHQINEVAKIFKETHSIHTHVVFELPKQYEQGLHGNDLTNTAEHSGKLNIWQRFNEKLRLMKPGTLNRVLPKRLEDVEEYLFKLFSMGVRAKLYGEASSKNFVKIGLEVRDAVRNLIVLQRSLEHISQTVSTYKWEIFEEKMYLGQSYDRSLSVIAGTVPKESLSPLDVKTWNKFYELVPTLKFALISYETGRYLNYHTGELFDPTIEQVNRIIKARHYLVEELIKIKKNIEDLQKRKESFESEDVEMAIKMTLTEWAKIAKVSELFEKF